MRCRLEAGTMAEPAPAGGPAPVAVPAAGGSAPCNPGAPAPPEAQHPHIVRYYSSYQTPPTTPPAYCASGRLVQPQPLYSSPESVGVLIAPPTLGAEAAREQQDTGKAGPPCCTGSHSRRAGHMCTPGAPVPSSCSCNGAILPLAAAAPD